MYRVLIAKAREPHVLKYLVLPRQACSVDLDLSNIPPSADTTFLFMACLMLLLQRRCTVASGGACINCSRNFNAHYSNMPARSLMKLFELKYFEGHLINWRTQMEVKVTRRKGVKKAKAQMISCSDNAQTSVVCMLLSGCHCLIFV